MRVRRAPSSCRITSLQRREVRWHHLVVDAINTVKISSEPWNQHSSVTAGSCSSPVTSCSSLPVFLPVFSVAWSSLRRSFRQSSAESVPLSGPGLHLSPAAGTRVLHRQRVQGEGLPLDQSLGPTSCCLRTSKLCLLVSAGQDHEPRGSQLVSGSSFPSPQHP